MSQYRKILKKEPMLYETSEYLYGTREDKEDVVTIAAVFVMAPVMYHIAKILYEQRKLPIECRYLYGFRYAWRTAQYHLLGKESLHYICYRKR